jgi:hypothetical protein
MYTRYFLRLACALVLCTACGGGNADDSGDPSASADSVGGATGARVTDSLAAAEVSSPARDSAASDSARVVDSIVAAIRACPRDGAWHPCSLERRLQMSGFRTVREDSVVQIPGVSEDAALWMIGRQSLRVVFFASASAADQAMSALDSARAAPRGDTTVVWSDRPTLLRSANALAVLIGGSERTVERIANAITAGPPQPERVTP